jgi:hypothetical protein
MPIRTPSAELSAHIQREIDALGPAPGEAWHLGAWPTRVFKEEWGALPIWADVIFSWGLRPDGTVLRMDRDALFHPTEPETDPLALFAALEQAARVDPALAPLVPDPPPGAHPCTTCGGIGYHEESVGDEMRGVSCLGCGGLGWIIRPDPPAPPAQH